MKTNKSVPETTISTVKANEKYFTVLTSEQLNWIKGGGIVPSDLMTQVAANKAR